MSEAIRLLLVEESKEDVGLLLRELRGAGFEVDFERVENGPDLRRALSEREWDIIISDFAMVGFDGLHALKIARELRPTAPFIFVSDALSEERTVQAKQAGALDCVSKDELRRLPEVVRHGRAAVSEALSASASSFETGPDPISQFTHDFNNLLAVVVSYSRFAQREVESGSTPHSDLEKVLDAAKGLEKLTKQLRARSGPKDGTSLDRLDKSHTGGVLPDFERLFAASPDFLLVLLPDSPRFTMVAATEARLQATHTTRAETIGVGLFELFPDNPDETDATGSSNLRASLERVLKTREADTMAVQKYDIRGPDGAFQTKYWSPKNIPVLAQSGAVAYILHRVEDVTDLVEASELGEVLRDKTRQMERDVITRSRELFQANQSLRDANLKLGELDAAKSTFFSNVSHEFRTPLTLLLGPLENALARDPPAVAPFEIQAMHRNAVRLFRLVNSLLDFSRIEAGKMQPRFSPTDLSTLTAGLAGSFQSLLDDSGLRLVVDCPPLPEPVYVDRSQWEKIVLNLISNAFKFTFQGEIHVSLEWHGDHVELKVRDTGTGIPEGEIPHLFKRFHRIEGAKGRSFEGTGIGLALVQELAQLHSGSVHIESTLGRGSTFTVHVPTGSAHISAGATSAASGLEFPDDNVRPRFEVKQWLESGEVDAVLDPPTPAAHSLSESDMTKSRILVVDDNTDMRNYVATLLAPFWTVETAAHGGLALEAARRSPPDLVLSDVMMPVMDGVSLLAELRRDPRTSAIPVILLSARAGEDARIEGLETGADDYLVKPFSARELLARVNTHLTMAAVRKNAAQTERELAETRAQLIAELEETNRSLVDSYNQLATTQAQLVHSAKMASLGELVAGIAHEINNPLAFVKSHLGTVRRALGMVENDAAAGEPPSLHQESWSKINSRLIEVDGGVGRIQELIVKLRTFSRLDEGERKIASIRECVDSVCTILHHRIGPEVALAVQLDGPDLVDCYPSLLNQALMNLVTNAIDAVGDDGTIAITSDEKDGLFRLSVSDTGPGVPESLRQRILEPFFTTKPVGRGTGLGLSITYSIAKKHGGTLEISDAKPHGALFALAFPMAAHEG